MSPCESLIIDAAYSALSSKVSGVCVSRRVPWQLVLEVKNESGKRQTWRAEMDNRFELEEIGVTADTFLPGNLVIVRGSPGRSQPNILYLLRLDRLADGLRYQQIDSTPSLDREPL